MQMYKLYIYIYIYSVSVVCQDSNGAQSWWKAVALLSFIDLWSRIYRERDREREINSVSVVCQDLNGAQSWWKAVALLPFIDRPMLRAEIEKRRHLLTAEEKVRVIHVWVNPGG